MCVHTNMSPVYRLIDFENVFSKVICNRNVSEINLSFFMTEYLRVQKLDLPLTVAWCDISAVNSIYYTATDKC